MGSPPCSMFQMKVTHRFSTEPSYDSPMLPCISSAATSPWRFEYLIFIKFSEVYCSLFSFRSFYWKEKHTAHSLALPLGYRQRSCGLLKGSLCHKYREVHHRSWCEDLQEFWIKNGWFVNGQVLQTGEHTFSFLQTDYICIQKANDSVLSSLLDLWKMKFFWPTKP